MKKELFRGEFVCKHFHHDTILDNITFNIFEGETLAILGANGAVKTPLVKIISGILQNDSGKLFYNDRPLLDYTMKKAQSLGIHIVQHHGRIADSLTIAENICLPFQKKGFINKKEMNARSKILMDMVGLDEKPTALCSKLNSSQKCLAELAAILYSGAKLLILDEPPFPYTENLREKITNVINKLKAKGSSVVYVTDNIKEALCVADRILVLRNGVCAGIFDKQNPYFNQKDLLSIMAGKNSAKENCDDDITPRGNIIMQVKNLYCNNISNISFDLYKGEILGFVGPANNKSTLLHAIYGYVPKTGGSIIIDGKPQLIHSPKDAVKLGISYFTSVQEKCYLIPNLTVMQNITLVATKRLSRFGWIKPRIEKHYASSLMEIFSIPPSYLNVPAVNLNSGIRQKLHLIQCMASKPKIMLLYEPTNGIDLETKTQIREGIKEMAKNGCTFIIVSSNMRESTELCDRFLVLSNGIIKGELSKKEAEQSRIIELMQNNKGAEK